MVITHDHCDVVVTHDHDDDCAFTVSLGLGGTAVASCTCFAWLAIVGVTMTRLG